MNGFGQTPQPQRAAAGESGAESSVGLYVNGAWRMPLPLSQNTKGGEVVSAEVRRRPIPYTPNPRS